MTERIEQSMHSDDSRELLKRLVISHGDLQMALSALTFLGEIDDDETYSKVELRRFKCFETTFVVAYGRAFKKSYGGAYGKLTFELLGLVLTPAEQELHEIIIRVRDSVYAHSDEAYAHARVDFLKLEGANGHLVAPVPQFDHGLEFADVYKRLTASELTRKVLDAVLGKMRELGETSQEFVYVRPATPAAEPDWREVIANRGSVSRAQDEE